jgi:hypothetical protein
MKHSRWLIAVILFIAWNALFAAVALNIGISWSFHSGTVTAGQRFLAAGLAWQNQRWIAAVLAQLAIAVLAYPEFRLSLRSLPSLRKKFIAFIVGVGAASLVTLLLVASKRAEIQTLRLDSLPQNILPLIFFLLLGWNIDKLLNPRLARKTHPFEARVLQIIPLLGVICIWLEPSFVEACLICILTFLFLAPADGLVFLAAFLTAGFGCFSWSLFGIEGEGLVRLQPLPGYSLRILEYSGVGLAALVWAIRVWYRFFYEFWKRRLKHLDSSSTSRTRR